MPLGCAFEELPRCYDCGVADGTFEQLRVKECE